MLTTIPEQLHSKVGVVATCHMSTITSYTFTCDVYMCSDPRKPVEGGSTTVAGPIGHYGVPMAYERSFKWKVGHFRNLCAVSSLYTKTCILCISQAIPTGPP